MGKVLRPHGLRGVLRIKSYARGPSSFKKGQSIFLRPPNGGDEIYTLSSLKPHKNIFLMKLKEIRSIDQAERLRESDIFVLEKDLEKKKEDEFYWFELIGLRVFLTTGEYLGKIEHILETGSNDVYVIKKEGKEILVPAIHDVVKNIDLRKREMIIEPIEGLLEMNEV